jgi:hypothetical protein
VRRSPNQTGLFLLTLYRTEFRNMRHQLDDVYIALDGREIPLTGCSRFVGPMADTEQPQKSEKYMSGAKIQILHRLTMPPKDFTRTTQVTGYSEPWTGTTGYILESVPCGFTGYPVQERQS